jgi:hypothetical protein
MTRRKRMLADLEQDIRDHLEDETQDNIDRGMSPEDAATRRSGSSATSRESKSRPGKCGASCGLSSSFRMFASAFVRCCEARVLR